MGSKPIVFLCFTLAIFFIIIVSSEVSASRDLAGHENKNNELNDAKYGGGGGGYPGGRYGGGGGGYPGGRYGGGGGGYCRYGCCRRNYYGRGCARCCGYKGEAIEAEPLTNSNHP